MTERFQLVLDFARRRRTAILVLALVLAVASGVMLTQVPFESNILKLIPQGGPAVQAFQTYVDRFDSLDYVYVLFNAPPGHTITEYEDVVEAYVTELRDVPQIEYVDATLFDADRDWDYLVDRILLLLGRDGASQALETFEPEGMEAALLRSREALTIPSASMRDLVQRDPLGLVLSLRSRFVGNKGFSQFDPTAEGYVSSDGRSRMVIAKPTGPAFDADFCAELLAELAAVERRVLSELESDELAFVGDEAPPPIGIELAGGYRATYEAENLIRGEMKLNALVSLVLLLSVIFVVFRSYWILMCAATTLGLAGLMTMVAVGLARGDLLAAASGGAAMLFGLGIDGIMLLYVRFLEERAQGADAETATRSLSTTVSSVLLGYITSVATFAALMLIDFPSLEELGRLVGLGMLLCAGLTLLLVPAFLSFQGPSGRQPRSPRLPRLAELVATHPRAILWVAGALTLASLVALPRLVVVASLEKIQPRTEGSRVQDELEERFQFPKNVVLVLAEGPELDPVLEKHRILARELTTGGEVSLASALAFLPPSSEQAAVSELVTRAGLSAEVVARRLEAAATRAGFRPGVFARFEERLPVLFDSSERITYDGLMEHGLGPVVSRFIVRNDNGYMAATYLYAETPSEVSRLAGVVASIDPSFLVTGQVLVNEELRASLLPQFLKGVVIGSVIVILLIYLNFRSVRLTLLCLLPTVLGLLWGGGLFAVTGIELDLFSVFGIVMVIGIGVDYGIHILHRFQLEGSGSIPDFLPWTGAAVALAAVTTTIGFGTLALSSYAPLGKLGIVSATCVVFIAFASLLVLPVVLGARTR